jgi:cystathionine beta-lyase
VIDRTGSDSTKWTGTREAFGVEDVLPLWVADMDFQAPPAVVEALVARARHGVYGYPRRDESHNQAIVNWMRRRHGWEIQSEWIVHVPGVVTALDLAVHALTHPGDRIVVQPPVYFPFFSIVRNNGRQMVSNPLTLQIGHYAMDLNDLEQHCDNRTKALILCSPHNPTGRVWSRPELLALGEVCVRKNLLILSDEIHSDLVLRGHKHTPMAMLSNELAQQTLTFIAPSKTFNVPGLCAAAVIVPNDGVRATFKATVENFGLLGNVFGITALQVAYAHGEEWLDQVLDYIEGNMEFAMRYIAERIPGIRPVCAEGTYLLWLDCRGLGLNGPALRDFFLTRARVALNDGPQFGEGGEGFQRMNLGCPRSILREALERIESAVKSLNPSSACPPCV